MSFGERGEVLVYADGAELARAAAAVFVETTTSAVAAKGRAFVALSGGSTPRQMGELLARPPFSELAPWPEIEVFWGDERWVPNESDENNAGVAMRTFLNRVSVEPSRVNPIPTDVGDPTVAATIYSTQLRTVFGVVDDVPVFDLIFLGMGDDGHTASLFPGTAAIHEDSELVVAQYVPKLESHRLTLTPPVLNAGKEVVFLVGGASKAPTLARVLTEPEHADELPAQVIRPSRGRLHWLTDEAAASRLQDDQRG
jgi:6-phosphogluconolactonase